MFRLMIIKFLLFCFVIDAHPCDVCIAAISRDELAYLPEWIEYHRTIGVKHFYLYDNLSQENYREGLKEYLDEGLIEIIDFPFEHSNVSEFNDIQCNAYKHAVRIADTKWLALIDTDEFIVPKVDKSLPDLMQRFEKYSALGINWRMFGTSGHRLLNGESMLKTLTSCADKDYSPHYHVKCIVRPSMVKNIVNPHFCILHKDGKQVNENKIVFEGPFSPEISYSLVQINHYWTRDETFLEKRVARRNKFFGDGQIVLKENEKALNIEQDLSIQRLLR